MRKLIEHKKSPPHKKKKKSIPFDEWKRKEAKELFREMWIKELNPANEIQHRAAEAILGLRARIENIREERLLVGKILPLFKKGQPGDLKVLFRGASPEDARVIRKWYSEKVLPEFIPAATEALSVALKYPFLRYRGGMASLLRPEIKPEIEGRIDVVAKQTNFSKEFISLVLREFINELGKRGEERALEYIGLEHLSPKVAQTLLAKKEAIIEALLK